MELAVKESGRVLMFRVSVFQYVSGNSLSGDCKWQVANTPEIINRSRYFGTNQRSFLVSCRKAMIRLQCQHGMSKQVDKLFHIVQGCGFNR